MVGRWRASETPATRVELFVCFYVSRCLVSCRVSLHEGSHLNEFAKSASIAFLPFSWILRVPVPVKCGCVMAGTPCGFQSVPVQQNQLFFSSSNTHSGLLQSLANSAPQPVPPRTVPSSWITPMT